jgi:hypothetical protein
VGSWPAGLRQTGDLASSSRTQSEARFERYLSENGYAFEHEPEWGVDKRPDYLISRAGVEAVCEVKEFTTTAITDALAGRRVGFLSDRQVFGAVRNQLDAAARQLKPLDGRGLPLVVVLANPHGADVSLEPNDVMAAMYGNPAFSMPIGPEGATGEGEYFLNRDGSVTAKHAYLSAVVTLHERSLDQDWADREIKRFEDPWEFIAWANGEHEAGRRPEGTRRFAHVFHTASAADGRATPLPDDVFDGPQDAMWKVVDGAYVQLRGASG